MLQAYQSCHSNEGWQAVRIQSDSDERIMYTVLVSPWKADESICDCPGWLYHGGKCKHQSRAWDKVCRWSEKDDHIQNPDERELRRCPRCGGPTKWEVEVVE